MSMLKLFMLGMALASCCRAEDAQIYNDEGKLVLAPSPPASGVVWVEGRLVLSDGSDVGSRVDSAESRLSSAEVRLALLETAAAVSPAPSAMNCTRCDANAICTPAGGVYGTRCTCGEGFRGSGLVCTPVNHCTELSHNCGPFAACLYLGPGAFRCACHDGFVADSTTVCAGGNLTAAIVPVSHFPLDETTLPFPYPAVDGGLFGTALALVGDVDGDFIPDLAIGASGDNSKFGAVYIAFLNRDGTYKSVVSTGFDECSVIDCGIGFSLAALQDLNGDGIPDLLVGNRLGNRAYVLFLHRNGTVAAHTRIDPTTQFLGETVFAFGTSVAYVGDMDNDGAPSVIVCDVPLGAVFLFELGTDGAPLGNAVSLNRDSTISNQASAMVGASVISLGDFDGDGTYDVIITVPRHASAGQRVQIVRVETTGAFATSQGMDSVSAGIAGHRQGMAIAYMPLSKRLLITSAQVGSSTALTVQDVLLDATAGNFFFSNYRQYTFDVLGGLQTLGTDFDDTQFALVSLGDLDLDGTDDFAMGMPDATVGLLSGTSLRTGEVRLILLAGSSTSVKVQQRISPAHGSMHISQPSNAFGFGTSIALVTDVDGDGIEDMLVGAQTRASQGAVALVWPTSTGEIKDLRWISRVSLGQPLALSFDGFGAAVLNFPDYDQLISPSLSYTAVHATVFISAPFYGNGVVYAVSLDRTGAETLVQVITPETDFGLTNPNGGQSLQFGASLASLGSLDVDDVDELAIGMPGYGSHGAVLITFMRNQLRPAIGAAQSHVILAPQEGNFNGLLWANSRFGASVAGLNDVNGDGVSDIAIGAYNASDASGSSGVFVVFLNETGYALGEQLLTGVTGGMETVLAGGGVGARLGASVAHVGDADGDGIDDMLLGLPEQGEAYLAMLSRDGTVRNAIRVFQDDSAEALTANGGAAVAAGSRSTTAPASQRTFVVGSPDSVNNGAVHILHYDVV